MQQEQGPWKQDQEIDIPEIVGRLEDTRQCIYGLSVEASRRFMDGMVDLPEPLRAGVLKKMAQELVNKMAQHYIDIMLIFRQKAWREGIDQEEVAATFLDIMQEQFPRMMELSDRITVRSIEDFVKINGITIGTQGLTRVDSAEEAQELLYSLPEMYCQPLKKLFLL